MGLNVSGKFLAVKFALTKLWAMLHVRSYSVRNKRRNLEAVSSFRRNRERRKIGVTLSNASSGNGSTTTEIKKKTSVPSQLEATRDGAAVHLSVKRTLSEQAQGTQSLASPLKSFESATGLANTSAMFEMCLKGDRKNSNNDKLELETRIDDDDGDDDHHNRASQASLRSPRVTFNCATSLFHIQPSW